MLEEGQHRSEIANNRLGNYPPCCSFSANELHAVSSKKNKCLKATPLQINNKCIYDVRMLYIFLFHQYSLWKNCVNWQTCSSHLSYKKQNIFRHFTGVADQCRLTIYCHMNRLLKGIQGTKHIKLIL